MRDQFRRRLRKTDLLTERSESWPAFLERKKLGAQISKLSRAVDPQIAGAQLCCNVRQDTELERGTVEHEALTFRRHDESLPPLAGKGERDGRRQRRGAAATVLQDVAQRALHRVVL